MVYQLVSSSLNDIPKASDKVAFSDSAKPRDQSIVASKELINSINLFSHYSNQWFVVEEKIMLKGFIVVNFPLGKAFSSSFAIMD